MPSLALYLVRHEEAEPQGELPEEHRALTPEGRRRMRRTARFLFEQGARIDAVVTSPLVRAVQTAEILSDALGFDGPVLARAIVAYPPSLEALVDLAVEFPADVRGLAIVGHEPTLERIAATLTGVERFGRPVKKGMVLLFDVDRAARRGVFRWALEPDGPRLEAWIEPPW